MDRQQYCARLVDAERQWLSERLGGHAGPTGSKPIAPEGVCVLDNYDCLTLPELTAIREAMDPDSVAAASRAWSELGQRLEEGARRFCAGVVAVLEGTGDEPGWSGVSGYAAVGAARRFTSGVVELATGMHTIGVTLEALAAGIGSTRELLPLLDAPADPARELLPAEGAFKAIEHARVEAESSARWILRTVYAPVIEQADGSIPFLMGPVAVVEGETAGGGALDDKGDRPLVSRVTDSDATQSAGLPQEPAHRDVPVEPGDSSEDPEKSSDPEKPSDSGQSAAVNQPPSSPPSHPPLISRPDHPADGPSSTPAQSGTSFPIPIPRPLDGQSANLPEGPDPVLTTPSDSRSEAPHGELEHPPPQHYSNAVPIGEQRPGRLVPLTRGRSEPAAAKVRRTSSAADHGGQAPHLIGMVPGPQRLPSDAGRRVASKDYLVNRRNGERLMGLARIPKTVPPVLGGQ